MICYVFFVSKFHSATLFSMYSAMRFISAESRIMRSKYLDCWFYSCGVAARRDATESKPTIRQYNSFIITIPGITAHNGIYKKNGVKILKQVQDDRLRFLSNTYILFTLNELHGIHCNYIFLVGGDNDGRNLRIGG